MGVYRVLSVCVLATAATLAVCGCSSAATLSGPLSYSRTGGIAGIVEHLAIQRSGSAKVSKGFRARSHSFKLSSRERARVENAVRAAHLRTVKVPKHPVTPDAFVFTISYAGRKLQFDDVSMPKALQGLVSVLGDLVVAHT
jgi:hypothetical protein